MCCNCELSDRKSYKNFYEVDRKSIKTMKIWESFIISILQDWCKYQTSNYRLGPNSILATNTFCFAVSASLQAVLYMSIVCLSSSLSLLISASTSSCKFQSNFVLIFYPASAQLYIIVHRQIKIYVYVVDHKHSRSNLDAYRKTCKLFAVSIVKSNTYV